MSVITISSTITKRVTLDVSEHTWPCKNHGQQPKVEDVYTRKKPKFQGTIAKCPCCDDSNTVFGYDVKDVIEKWNKLNNPIN